MVTAKPAIRLTYADYCLTPDDERYELLDGELLMAPAPIESHQIAVMELGTLLHTFVKARGLGQVFSAPYDVVLSETDVVQPDLLFVSNERAHIRTPANVRGAPDLVVEILSPSTASRDWRDKLDLYAEYGVKEYWLVDPDARTVTVLLLEAGAFAEVARYGAGQTLTSPTLAGFTTNLDDIL
jgi:Uma2 family endonuclease